MRSSCRDGKGTPPLPRQRGRVGVGVLPQNGLIERIEFPPPDALLRAPRPPPQAGEVKRDALIALFSQERLRTFLTVFTLTRIKPFPLLAYSTLASPFPHPPLPRVPDPDP